MKTVLFPKLTGEKVDKKQYRNHVSDAILEKIPEFNNLDPNKPVSVINSVMMESANYVFRKRRENVKRLLNFELNLLLSRTLLKRKRKLFIIGGPGSFRP